MVATQLVRFFDTLKRDSEMHFGLLLNDNSILCLCCGGILEEEDYQIVERYNDIFHADIALKKYFDLI